MIKHSHENSLLAAAAALVIDSGRQQDVDELLAHDLNWRYLLEAAGRHGTIPLLFRAASASPMSSAIPGDVLETLRHTYLVSLMQNQKHYNSLKQVLTSLDENQVPVIVMKGAALCLTIYDDIALRPFGDLDILVHRKDVTLCQQRIESLGYELIRGIYFPLSDEENDEKGCEWSYRKEASVVEIHWDLLSRTTPLNIDIDLFWRDPVTVEFNGRKTLLMSPENQLIHLCLHQYKHHWEHLRDLVDVGLLLKESGESLDWDLVVANSKSQGLELCVYYTLALAQKLLAIELPSGSMAELLGQSRPSRAAGATLSLIVDRFFEENLPRRFWELILVRGFRTRVGLVREILRNPFPRHENRTTPHTSSRSGRAAAAMRSLLYYRSLFINFFRHVSRSRKSAKRQ